MRVKVIILQSHVHRLLLPRRKGVSRRLVWRLCLFLNSNLHNMIKRFDIGTRMSQMVVHNGTVYLAGQVAKDTNQEIEGQTRQVLEAIDALLARAATDKSQLLTVQIYLVDMADFDGMNRAWDAWVPVGHVPTLSLIHI